MKKSDIDPKARKTSEKSSINSLNNSSNLKYKIVKNDEDAN
jgi:hypothetical protein